VASQVDSLRFNQIKGRTLTGYFRDNELYRINIEGNGESIYYLIDGENIIGMNTTRCSSIEILVEDGKINVINQFGSPEGVIDPPSLSPETNPKLKGFNWFDGIRPKEKLDIFK